MTSRKSIIGPLQTAIYSRLSGDGTLLGIVTAVWDSVPPEATLPYVVLGEFASVPQRFVGGGPSLVLATFDLEVHDDDTAVDTIASAVERINTLLDDYAITITDYATVYCHLEREAKTKLPEINVQRIDLSFSVAATRT